MFILEKAVRPNILKVKPYRCARDDYSEGILLDANENSFGPVLQEPKDFTAQLHRYPDPYQTKLKEKVGKVFKVEKSEIFVGNGSDEAIDLLFRVFCEPGKDKVLICPPTYGMYKVAASIHDVEVVEVPLAANDFQLDVKGILEAAKDGSNVKLMFLCSPGNPTGTLLNLKDIKQILDLGFERTVVVVDEAYIDFTEQPEKSTALSLSLKKYPNSVVLRTLSKAYGLAGLRMGFALANANIIQLLNNIKAPYNISSVTGQLGIDALSETSVQTMKKSVENILLQRTRLLEDLLALKMFKLRGGLNANFLLVEFDQPNSPVLHNENAFKLYKYLAERQKDNIVVRYRGDNLNCPGCLRITVGTEYENKVLIEAVKEFIIIYLGATCSQI